MVGGFENSFNGAWVNTFNNGDANFHAVLLDSVKNWQEVLAGFGMKNDHAGMKFEQVGQVFGRFGSHHVNVDGPTLRPPNSRFVNSGALGEGAIGDINMNALSERVVALNKFFVLGRVVTENARSDNCNRHVSPRLICDNGADIFRREGVMYS